MSLQNRNKDNIKHTKNKSNIKITKRGKFYRKQYTIEEIRISFIVKETAQKIINKQPNTDIIYCLLMSKLTIILNLTSNMQKFIVN